MKKKQSSGDDLEKKIYQVILTFPDRIDEMETRNEENCRRLAQRLASLFREELDDDKKPRK